MDTKLESVIHTVKRVYVAIPIPDQLINYFTITLSFNYTIAH